ncbi:hypothetical protein D3C78_1452900 [compost metagenome]
MMRGLRLPDLVDATLTSSLTSPVSLLDTPSKSSTAPKIGSGFRTMPPPPPYGVSSTVLCLFPAYSRKLIAFKDTIPFPCALPRILL